MQNRMKPKPEWLRKKISPSVNRELESIFRESKVNTVCQEAICPNISECFSKKNATFLILGTICTRACSFCAVAKGRPLALDSDEPKNVALTVKQLGLKHVVITSSTRDDLKDGGAEHFCKTVNAIKSMDDSIVVELLISDMREDENALKLIANSGVEIVGHNLETVPRLYDIRKGSDYNRSLRVLKLLSSLNPSIKTKSGIMLGFGERDDEVKILMQDLLDEGCKYLSIGQYLSPSNHHAKVVEYVKPERFEYLRKLGMEMGFEYIKSSPYTRSSYMAHEYMECGV
ncbi:MAG: lipoyl synthase [Campylobacterota bacterium]|nr:lipoyl synthase [Campylobacterota bacterium]